MEFKYYPKIYIISPNKHNNSYKSFLDRLKENGIIDDNKNWKAKNTCLIYNCPSLQKDKNENYYNLYKIIHRYKKLKLDENEYGNKIVLLYHPSRSEIIKPIKIGDIQILHNSYIKNLLKSSNGVVNNASIDNLKGYIDKFINNAVLKTNFNREINKVRNPDKLNNIYHLNKVAVVYNYLNNDNKLMNITTNNMKNHDTIRILNGNQFTLF